MAHLVGADGLPLNGQKRAEAVGVDQGGNVLGYIVCKREPDGRAIPAIDKRDSALMITGDPNEAGMYASQLANSELVPKHGEIVDPAKKSNVYMVLKLVGVAIIQAKPKIPEV